MRFRICHNFGLVIFYLLFANELVSAQSTWSVPKGTMEMQFAATVYIETVYPKPGATKGVNDTLSGSGFLISDSGRVYLVTAKHLVLAKLMGKDQHLAHNAIFISHSFPVIFKGFTITGLSTPYSPNQAYVFSSDQQDIAVIALQKIPHVLEGLLKQAAKPVPADSLDTVNDRYPDETYYHTTYMVNKNKMGEKVRAAGLRPGKVKTFDDKKSLFTIDEYINHACAGSGLFIGGKIIGMVLGEPEVTSNADIIKYPNRHTNTGIVVKASLIIPLLRKLQKQEAKQQPAVSKPPAYKK